MTWFTIYLIIGFLIMMPCLNQGTIRQSFREAELNKINIPLWFKLTLGMTAYFAAAMLWPLILILSFMS